MGTLTKAEADLENLCMHDNQCIVKYLIDFNYLTAWVQWGDAALHQQLYHGLPSWIKDKIAHISKSDTLSKLHSLTQSINSHYWECCSEVARENPTTNKNKHSNNKGKGNAMPLRTLTRIKTTTVERATPVTLVMPTLAVAILTRKNPTLTSQ